MKFVQLLTVIIAPILIYSPVYGSEITFSGDARARVIVREDTLFGNEPGGLADIYDSRVRLVVNAKAPGGAYAKGRFKMDSKWGVDEDVRTSVDMAYLGIPFGRVVVEAGNMKNNVTRFFEWDQAADQFLVYWDMFDIHWRASYRVIAEGQESIFEINRLEDNDNEVFGLVAIKELNERIYGQASFFYADDDRDALVTGKFIEPASGAYGSIFFEGSYKKFSLHAEAAYKAGNVRQSRDETGAVINLDNVNRGDGWGWYAEGKYSFESTKLYLNTGMAISGYEADNDFGWILLGNSNNEPISVISKLGANGDWFWIGASLENQPHERISAIGHVVLVRVDAVTFDDDSILQYRGFIETSADLSFEITEGAVLTWKLGLLLPRLVGTYKGGEVEEDITFATYARLQVNF